MQAMKMNQQHLALPYDPANPPKVDVNGKPLPKNHFSRVARHEAGHLLLNWLLDNRPCGAMLLANGEACSTSEHPDDSLMAIGLAKVAGFVAAGEKRHLRSIRANWDRPQTFAIDNDCHWVTAAAQHALDDLAPNLGWLFIEALIRTVEEACLTYGRELAALAAILKRNGYIKYPETETIFKAMDEKYKVRCPDWVLDRCLDHVQAVYKEHQEQQAGES